MSVIKKIARVGNDCVACGRCVRECPVKALFIDRGMRAVVDDCKCAGCGKCSNSCPANVIALVQREVLPYENTVV